MTKVTLTIDGMECPNCAMKLEGIEDRLPGVRRAEASYRKGLFLVEYDEEQISEGQICQAVKNLGYQVTGKV